MQLILDVSLQGQLVERSLATLDGGQRQEAFVHPQSSVFQVDSLRLPRIIQYFKPISSTFGKVLSCN